MSKKVNPTTIGAFVIGGLALTIAALGYLGAAQFFSEHEGFVSYFQSSVSGLSVGAPVKFRGIPIGQVTGVNFYRDPETTDSYIEVLLEVDLDVLAELGAAVDVTDREIVNDAIDRGVRAQLQLESFVTGQLYIGIDLRPESGPPRLVNPDGPFMELPTIPPPMAELGESAGEVLARLGAVDLPAISTNLAALLDRLNNKLDALDVRQLTDAMVGTLTAVQQLAESDDIPLALEQLRGTLDAFESMAQSLDQRLDPMLARFDTTAMTLNATLQSLNASAERTNAMFAPEASFRYELERMLAELSKTAQAMSQLVVFLERNPRAPLTGKPINQR